MVTAPIVLLIAAATALPAGAATTVRTVTAIPDDVRWTPALAQSRRRPPQKLRDLEAVPRFPRTFVGLPLACDCLILDSWRYPFFRGLRLSKISDLLRKTSRTFALTIPLLPEPTAREVTVAYLLFRIIDTFEDATNWTPKRRIEALARFVKLMDEPPEAARELVLECQREPPIENPGYQELLSETATVLGAFRELRTVSRVSIRQHLARSAEGMGRFVARADGPQGLQITSLEDLCDYCYRVAGIVGEMLTELFLLNRPKLAPVAQDLRKLAAKFGEGLQLINILKDTYPDQVDGRVYLPSQAQLSDVFDLAEQDLSIAAAYTEILRSAGVERGLVAFNDFIGELAAANLAILRKYGLGARLSRLHVAEVAVRVAQRARQSSFRFTN
jgi:farnesyl-diphosphate farnesyltransferase